uniref:DUF4231 domain-containing protein n=1 Tax=viral metagenome TaxID=1070528 RepID=A0A6C0L0Y2_9ZZZZ|tara:strand:+ start:1597 stop:2358 length:762 start_codon:yes stop_codon:yes gene_type:complete
MSSFSSSVGEIVDDLELQKPYDKAIIRHRFLNEINYYEQKRDSTKKYYNTFRFIVTTGSILLPAILSMGQMDPTKLPRNFDMVSYWASWSISLLVTASNGFLQLFSLDKNYFSYSMVVEQLKTEGWQFFGLSGKYEDYPNHQTAYKNFSKSIESIKRKQVEQEFQNGKGDNKKKKFNFQGEMKNFAESQQATHVQMNENKTAGPNKLTEELQDLVSGKIQEGIADVQAKGLEDILEESNIDIQITDTKEEKKD